MLLTGVTFAVAGTIYCLYRLMVALLVRAGSLPGVGRVITAESTKGVDKFRFSVGNLFNWNVTVNPEKGTVGGSIQVGTPKGWFVLGIVIALGAAFVIPKVAGVLLPAALVAIAVGFFKKAMNENSKK